MSYAIGWAATHNNALIQSGEARLAGGSRLMLYLGFDISPRSVFWLAYFNGRSDNADVIQLMKYSLRSLLLVTLVAGFAAAYIARNLRSKTPISQITTSKEWYAKAGPKSNVLLIVDNSFHNETKYEFERYDSICKNFRWRYRQDPILFMDPMKNSELWGIVENLWRNHELNSDFHFGYKGYGGRGVVCLLYTSPSPRD